MFTGLIQDIGEIKAVTRHKGGDLSIEIGTGLDMAGIPEGASIACSGCCLTVTEKTSQGFRVDVSGESLSKTIIGTWDIGTKINLEPSLKMGDELGGHFVFGHVDTLAIIKDIREEGQSFRLKIEVPEAHAQFIAPKGSVALDGISLTVNEVETNLFGVNIIPHTWQKTTLQFREVGDKLNFEVDMLARYVARQISSQTERQASQ